MSEAPATSRTRRVRLVLAVVLTLLLLGLVTWKVELAPLLRALSGAQPLLVALALFIALGSNTLGSAEVLGQALSALGVRVSRSALLGVTLENLSFQAALPVGAGHASRAFSLVRAVGVDPKRAALSVPVVLGSKLAALSLFVAVGIADRYPLAPTLAGVALAAGFTIARRRHALSGFALFRALVAALVLTGLQVAVFGVLLAALGASVPLFAILFYFPLCLVLAKLPVTWMGFGTRDAAVVALFAGLADPGTLAAAALVFGVFDQIVPGLFGLAFTPRFARRIIDP
jgi:uncharacterized membrane protein YbhN (UPF0104 family)